MEFFFLFCKWSTTPLWLFFQRKEKEMTFSLKKKLAWLLVMVHLEIRDGVGINRITEFRFWEVPLNNGLNVGKLFYLFCYFWWFFIEDLARSLHSTNFVSTYFSVLILNQKWFERRKKSKVFLHFCNFPKPINYQKFG